MIGLYAKIPFHSQLRKADDKLAADLSRIAREAAASFGGVLHPTEESFFLCFDDSLLPCRLRAAEAARYLASRLKGLAPRLHGWSLFLKTGFALPEEGLREARRLWYGTDADGLFLSPEAAAAFAPYFRAKAEPSSGSGPGSPCLRVTEAPYATRALPVEGSLSMKDERAIERIVDEIGEQVLGEGRSRCVAVLGPGGTAGVQLEAALETLYKGEAAGFLRLRAPACSGLPFGPVVEGLASLAVPSAELRQAEFLSGAERGLLEELGPMLELIRRSPYRQVYSATFEVRLRLRAAAAFRLYARERRSRSLPPFVLLEEVERFPPESIALLADLIGGKLADEGLSVLASGRALPEGWPSVPLRRAAVAGPSPSAIAKASREAAEAMGEPGRAAELAAAAAGDPFRLRLAQRIALAGPAPGQAVTTAELAAAALSTFPPEYAGFFLALRLCEGALDQAGTEDFLDSIGYVSGIRPLIQNALAELGLVELGLAERGPLPRLASPEVATAIESAVADGGESIVKAFAARLLELRDKRRILPSAGLYRRIAAGIGQGWGRYGNLRLFLDCVAADGVYGSSGVVAAEAAMPLAAMGAFLAAYAEREREPALALLADLESTAERLAAGGPASAAESADASVLRGSLALARGAAEYADRRPQAAASKAKAALIELHSRGAPASCARAQRLLGLCSLAQEQVQEGSDYLANAFELAESVPDPLECILSAEAEAASHFLLGDLRRARQRARSAAAWAEKSYRADWEAACAFVDGRIALELGDCRAAEESFGRVRAEARVYDRAQAASRAEIWTGRSAAWAGEAGRARDILGRHPADAEALWFLAELEAWEGRPAEARDLAERALGAVGPREYPSADAFSWASGFESVEERAVGFCGARSFLEDQILAFRDFAAGMSEPEVEGPRRAELLAIRAREERLAALHPAAHLFLFYRYLVLEECSPASMDGATSLSKAFKALQTRAGRMEEAKLKDSFMEGNPWNRRLLAEAKARKLI